MRIQRPIPFGGILFLLACIVLLGSLGIWQVKRLQWKETLIATYNKEYTRDPLENPFDSESLKAVASKDPAMEYGSVRGQFHHDLEILIGPRTQDGKPGYHIITPLSIAGGNGRVLVNRGWVPLDKADPTTRFEGQTEGMVTLTGMARLPDRPNPFTPANDPTSHTWYSVNPQDIGLAVNMPGFPDVVFYAETQDPPLEGPWPQMMATRVLPHNNHLQYAIFWFTMMVIFTVLPLGYAFYERPVKEEE